MRDLQENYRPGIDEPYMNPDQMEYFRHRLMELREQAKREYEESHTRVKEEKTRGADLMDQVVTETDLQMDLRIRERARALLIKIDAALQRIDDGTYGYCEETGEEIGIKRLEAQPLANLSIEAQEEIEQILRKRRNFTRH